MRKEDNHTRSGELHTFILLFLCLMVFSSASVYVLNNKGLPVFRYPAKSTPTPLPTAPAQISRQARCNEEDVTLKVKPSTDQGYCELSMTLTGYTVSGYTLRYPEIWTVNTAGAEAMNLFFNKGTDTEVFIQLTSSNLALEQADKATYSFESSEAIPLVDPDETEVSRKIEEVGGINTLRLLTSLDDQTVVRYFLTHVEGDKTSVYMFKTTGESDAMEESVRKMISTFSIVEP